MRGVVFPTEEDTLLAVYRPPSQLPPPAALVREALEVCGGGLRAALAERRAAYSELFGEEIEESIVFWRTCLREWRAEAVWRMRNLRASSPRRG